ncbi:MAG: hypothetical protein JJV95_01015 [Sulfurospirillum sp.]|nr:hypothetical protein [Sulfurospirillum sp.]MBL0702549.1 hypothetical protein [Sulfurospirillum sp.]
MFLTPEIIAIYTLNIIFLFFSIFAFIISINIVMHWNVNRTDERQYGLEKKSILVATIIKFIFILKLPLFIFFVFTANKISGVITGAMCAAGVVNSISFGLWLFVFKILNLFIFGFWIALHNMDTKDEQLSLTKLKFSIFIVAFMLLVIEIIYEISFFSSLNIDKIVSCCGTLFSVASSSSFSFIFNIPSSIAIGFFYLIFSLLVVFSFLKNEPLFLVINIIFFITALISLILFFGTYIYELPTHHCPYCFLQQEYYYVGYLLYITLFIGTFSGISGSILSMLNRKNRKDFYKKSLLFNSIYVAIVTAYPIVYYIKNGVWL